MSEFQLDQTVYIAPTISSVISYEDDYVMKGQIVRINTETEQWADGEPKSKYKYYIELEDSLEYVFRTSEDIYATREEAIAKAFDRLVSEHMKLVNLQNNITKLKEKIMAEEGIE
jgi:hypothetical protein